MTYSYIMMRSESFTRKVDGDRNTSGSTTMGFGHRTVRCFVGENESIKDLAIVKLNLGDFGYVGSNRFHIRLASCISHKHINPHRYSR